MQAMFPYVLMIREESQSRNTTFDDLRFFQTSLSRASVIQTQKTRQQFEVADGFAVAPLIKGHRR